MHPVLQKKNIQVQIQYSQILMYKETKTKNVVKKLLKSYV